MNAPQATPTLPDAQTVIEVQHYTDRLFSFKVTRPRTLRFRSGEFVMIGLLKEDGKPLLRAYSIASPAWDDELEFYSIKVQDGPLTSKLQHIKKGDQIILRPKPVGTLVHDALLPGKRIWLFATGTGIAPFASILREPQTYEDYEQIMIQKTFISNFKFLKEGENVNVLFHADQGMPLAASLPSHVILKIKHTEPGIKGNTATNTFKPATTETEADIQVPLFIEEGDKIKIDTEKGIYIERVK